MKIKDRRKAALISLKKVEQANALEALATQLGSIKALEGDLANVSQKIALVKEGIQKSPASATAACLESDFLARQIAFGKLKLLQDTRTSLESDLRFAKQNINKTKDMVKNATCALKAVEKLS